MHVKLHYATMPWKPKYFKIIGQLVSRSQLLSKRATVIHWSPETGGSCIADQKHGTGRIESLVRDSNTVDWRIVLDLKKNMMGRIRWYVCSVTWPGIWEDVFGTS